MPILLHQIYFQEAGRKDVNNEYVEPTYTLCLLLAATLSLSRYCRGGTADHTSDQHRDCPDPDTTFSYKQHAQSACRRNNEHQEGNHRRSREKSVRQGARSHE